MPPPDALSAALDALEKGVAPVPCVEGTKVPAVRWREWQDRLPPETLVRAWFAVRRNVAVVTSGMVLFDCDDPAQADLVLAHCGDTPHRVRTPRGGLHLVYRLPAGVALTNRVRVLGLGLDIRTTGGIEVIPPSRTEQGAYTWLGDGLRPAADLPEARVEWTRTPRPASPAPAIVPAGDRGHLVRRAGAYLSRVEGAVSGQGGHARTFRAACVLARKFGLTFAEAWPLLAAWNETCVPPWSEPELRHKLEDALKDAR